MASGPDKPEQDIRAIFSPGIDGKINYGPIRSAFLGKDIKIENGKLFIYNPDGTLSEGSDVDYMEVLFELKDEYNLFFDAFSEYFLSCYQSGLVLERNMSFSPQAVDPLPPLDEDRLAENVDDVIGERESFKERVNRGTKVATTVREYHERIARNIHSSIAPLVLGKNSSEEARRHFVENNIYGLNPIMDLYADVADAPFAVTSATWETVKDLLSGKRKSKKDEKDEKDEENSGMLNTIKVGTGVLLNAILRKKSSVEVDPHAGIHEAVAEAEKGEVVENKPKKRFYEGIATAAMLLKEGIGGTWDAIKGEPSTEKKVSVSKPGETPRLRANLNKREATGYQKLKEVSVNGIKSAASLPGMGIRAGLNILSKTGRIAFDTAKVAGILASAPLWIPYKVVTGSAKWGYGQLNEIGKDVVKIVATAGIAAGAYFLARQSFYSGIGAIKFGGRMFATAAKTVAYPVVEFGKTFGGRLAEGYKWGAGKVDWPQGKAVSGGLLSKTGGHIRNAGAWTLRNGLSLVPGAVGLIGYGAYGAVEGSAKGLYGAITGQYKGANKKKIIDSDGNEKEVFAHGGMLEFAENIVQGGKDQWNALSKASNFGPFKDIIKPGEEGKRFTWWRKLDHKDIAHLALASGDAKFEETYKELLKANPGMGNSLMGRVKLYWDTLLKVPSDKAKNVTTAFADMLNIDGPLGLALTEFVAWRSKQAGDPEVYELKYHELGKQLLEMDAGDLKKFLANFDFDDMLSHYELLHGAKEEISLSSKKRMPLLAKQVKEFFGSKNLTYPGFILKVDSLWDHISPLYLELRTDPEVNQKSLNAFMDAISEMRTALQDKANFDKVFDQAA